MNLSKWFGWRRELWFWLVAPVGWLALRWAKLADERNQDQKAA